MKKTSIAFCIALFSSISFAQDKPKIIVHGGVDTREVQVQSDVPQVSSSIGGDSPFGTPYETVPYTPQKQSVKTIVNTEKPYIKQDKQPSVTPHIQSTEKNSVTPINKKLSEENKPIEKKAEIIPKVVQESKPVEAKKNPESETKVEKPTKKIAETTGQLISADDLIETIQSYGKPVQIQVTKMPDDKQVVLLSGKRFVLDSAPDNSSKQNDSIVETDKKDTTDLKPSQQIGEMQKLPERVVIDTSPVVKQESKTPTMMTFIEVSCGLLLLAGLVYFFFGRKRQESYWFS